MYITTIDNDSVLSLTLVVIVLLLLYDVSSNDDVNSYKLKKKIRREKGEIRLRLKFSTTTPPTLDKRVSISNYENSLIMSLYIPPSNQYLKENLNQNRDNFDDDENDIDSLYDNNKDSHFNSKINLQGGMTDTNDNDLIIDMGSRLSYQLTLIPFLPNCDADSYGAKEMKKLFPDDSIIDILRFLIARKGDVSLAADMMRKSKSWHLKNLPIHWSPQIAAVSALKCFFFHKTARDGSPVLYFRGALYDNTKASAETYILIAAHLIDYVLKRSNHISITVFVHSAAVPGAANQNPDLEFIKGFSSVMSDNFPERMKRLVLWPFPWYGRAIWSCVRMFVDKRTQEKIFMIPPSGNSLPNDLVNIIDPYNIPATVGGYCQDEIITLESTLGEANINENK